MKKNMEKKRQLKEFTATTDKAKGALKNLATEEGYETFVVPDDVGGRFSVLTAVGLLPIAVSGADIDKLMEGAASARKRCSEQCISKKMMLCSMRLSATFCFVKVNLWKLPGKL